MPHISLFVSFMFVGQCDDGDDEFRWMICVCVTAGVANGRAQTGGCGLSHSL